VHVICYWVSVPCVPDTHLPPLRSFKAGSGTTSCSLYDLPKVTIDVLLKYKLYKYSDHHKPVAVTIEMHDIDPRSSEKPYTDVTLEVS
jgi:hypothetical protein